MTNSKREIPWSEIGIVDAKNLIPSCDKASREFKNALAGIDEAGIPDFEDNRWKYEFCIFWMFWMRYVATSPNLVNAAATKPLLDAYHRACCEAMVRAGLLENSQGAIRHWEDDLQKRFQIYRKAYDQHWTKTRNPFSDLLRDSVGWSLASYLFPGQQPSAKLVILLNELGSVRFTGLAGMFRELEARYARQKPRWKFWK